MKAVILLSEPQLRVENVFYVDCHDLNKFAEIHLEGYGVEWDALYSEECNNGSIKKCRVRFGAEIEDDLDQDFGNWLTGGYFYRDMNWSPSCQHILQWMCNRGWIPEGTYVVDLWW